ATVTRIQGAEDYFRIALTVRSTNPADPLRDAVQFFLHPTFRNPRPIVNVGPNGMAELHLTAWGAFTVGAITDNGKTKLELDLSELASAPEEFKNR
ncbi:MAG TPA: pYEATS domain-containing protein, partial [Thermoanaerobaculia bacterium]|nr:pYEATS domain-containing protein [Thermoanaerobaculia bacterium]